MRMNTMTMITMYLISVVFTLGYCDTVGYNRVIMIWPKSECLHGGCIVVPNNYIMHGVWPASHNGASVTDCPGPEYDGTLIPEDVKAMMANCWSGLRKNNEVFWAEEWNKHGRCSSFSQQTYFTSAVTLCTQLRHEIQSAFSHRNIVPGNAYKPDWYYKAIVRRIKLKPVIRCVARDGLDHKALLEVWFCTDLYLNLWNCPAAKTSQKFVGCGPPRDMNNTLVYYPS